MLLVVLSCGHEVIVFVFSGEKLELQEERDSPLPIVLGYAIYPRRILGKSKIRIPIKSGQMAF